MGSERVTATSIKIQISFFVCLSLVSPCVGDDVALQICDIQAHFIIPLNADLLHVTGVVDLE